MIDKFLEYIAVEKRYSEHTLISYKKDLEDFLLFVSDTEGTRDLTKVDKKVIRNFLVHLTENHFQKRSINRKLSSLRSFYLFLLKIGEIEVSPLESVSSLKFYAEKQIPMSEEEMAELSEILDEDTEHFLEKAIIETLYQTGIRKAELCNLFFENVDFSSNEIKIKGKGNKERIVQFRLFWQKFCISLQKLENLCQRVRFIFSFVKMEKNYPKNLCILW